MTKPNVIIFRDHLLNPSETFVLAQARNLQKFRPYYVGSRRVPGLRLPAKSTIVINNYGAPAKLLEVPFKLWGFAPIFFQRVMRLNPVLAHAHFGPDGALALPMIRKLQIPLIVTFHGYDATVKPEDAQPFYFSSHRMYFRRQEALKRETSLFIAVSKFVKSKLLEQGFPPNKIKVHYIGINVDEFRPDASISRDRTILFVGRLVEKKGCEYLIKAMNRVKAKFPDAELVVVGDGPLRASLEKLASQELQRFRFLGWQTPKQVRSWMNKARILCGPSITSRTGDTEGFGLVFAEAQAMELPVVGFNSGGIPEVIDHGSTGFLVPERDTQALAEMILRLLENSSLWEQFSKNSRERVCALFDLQKQTRKLEDLYTGVLQRNV